MSNSNSNACFCKRQQFVAIQAHWKVTHTSVPNNQWIVDESFLLLEDSVRYSLMSEDSFLSFRLFLISFSISSLIPYCKGTVQPNMKILLLFIHMLHRYGFCGKKRRYIFNNVPVDFFFFLMQLLLMGIEAVSLTLEPHFLFRNESFRLAHKLDQFVY